MFGASGLVRSVGACVVCAVGCVRSGGFGWWGCRGVLGVGARGACFQYGVHGRGWVVVQFGLRDGQVAFFVFFVIAQARLPGVVMCLRAFFVFFWCAVGCAGRLWWLLVCRALGLAVGRRRLRVVVFLGRGGRCWVFGSALGIVVGAACVLPWEARA